MESVRNLFVAALLLITVACSGNFENHDRDLKLSRDDYKNVLSNADIKSDAPPIPAYQPIMAEPDPTPGWADKRVTLSLDGSMPIKDVFVELAHQAKMDLEMDPAITAPPMIFTARDRPLGEVIDRLTIQNGLRAVIDNHILRIEYDRPFIKAYRVDYPSIARSSNSSISSSLNIAAATEGDGNKNESAATTDGKSEADFWAEMSANLTQILGSTTAASADGSATAAGPQFSVNRQAGIISVQATAAQHKQVADYLSRVKASTSAQVLIEARILEVSLVDEFKSGINWSTLAGGAFDFGVTAPTGTLPVTLDPLPSSNPGLSLNITNNDFQGLFNFLETFGTVRALSSPRMTVMQNQVGVIKVVENEVYFRLTIESTDASTVSPGRTDITSEQRTVPIGLIMNVQPSIDLATNNVTLALRPTITRISGRRTDPSILIAASDAGLTPNQVDSTVPVVSVQEMDSVVSLKSGQTLVMGGLMRDSSNATDEGVPGISEIPVAGLLAKGRDDSTKKTELVVFLKATIVKKAEDTISTADQKLYKGFSADRRPINVETAN